MRMIDENFISTMTIPTTDDDNAAAANISQPCNAEEAENDLEDGEIEDDDDEVPPPAEEPPAVVAQPQAAPPPAPLQQSPVHNPPRERSPPRPERRKHEDKKRPLTEAEKSVMYLHKLERAERERKEKYRKDMMADDFASNIEKAIEKVLKKERPQQDKDDDSNDEKRGRKRKKKDKEKKKHKNQKMMESPKRGGGGDQDCYDDNDMMQIKGGSPDRGMRNFRRDRSPHYDSDGPDEGSPHAGGGMKGRKRMRGGNNDGGGNGNRNNRNRICLFYLQGKCQKSGEECGYSHDACLPMKLELCKFYLMDCCAKGDKCLYLHAEFPCKFYHTGLPCYEGDKCKFSHGKPLTEAFKQILYKHIETAPKEILGDFPRLSREDALNRINNTQKNLEAKFNATVGIVAGGDSDGQKNALIPSLFDINVSMPAHGEEGGGNNKQGGDSGGKPGGKGRKSRWQDCDPMEAAAAIQEHQRKMQMQQQQQQQIVMGLSMNMGMGIGIWKDQDMRVNTNGDVDMRAMPPMIPPPQILANIPAPAPVVPIMVPNVPPPQLGTVPPPAVPTLAATSVVTPSLTTAPPILSPPQIPPQPAEIPASLDINTYKSNEAATAIVSSTSLLSSSVSNQDLDSGHDELNLSIVEEQPPEEEEDDDESKGGAGGGGGAGKAAMDDDGDMSDENEMLTIDEKLDDAPLLHLPKKQRELFLRIQGVQKDTAPDAQQDGDEQSDKEDWYSDDEDEEQGKSNNVLAPATIKPMEVMEKLGDLSKIDISAEVTKLLSTINQQQSSTATKTSTTVATPATSSSSITQSPSYNAAEPAAQPAAKMIKDPRLMADRGGDAHDKKDERKVSIYEQGSLSLKDQREMEEARKKTDVDLRNLDMQDLDMRSYGDTDLRQGRPDMDLRQLPFKPMQNYTPATEIDASIGSHSPMVYKVHVIHIPRPDYTGLKLSAQDAMVSGDPRLRKIFRLSTDEKDSPASPPPKSSSPPKVRVDPRRRDPRAKHDAGGGVTNVPDPVTPGANVMQQPGFPMDSSMSYTQQINLIQNSAFYQSLTPAQKMLFNQEIAAKANKTPNDPVLSGIMSSLGLSGPPVTGGGGNIVNGGAVNILANVNNMQGPPPNMGGPMMGGPPNMMGGPPGQPGLLGAAPGIPNMGGGGGGNGPPPDFPIMDPRNGGGLLGQAPFPPFGGPPDNQGNFPPYVGDDFYPNEPPPNFGGGGGNNNGGGGGGGNRNDNRHFRDNRDNRGGRRGRSWNNRHNNNNRNYNRNRNRSNRSHSPP